MRTKQTIRLVAVSAVASLAIAGSAQARNGADDPAGHAKGPRDDAKVHMRQGADDPANHNAGDDRRVRQARHRHRGRGKDDARPHMKHGADDPKPHFKRGADDPAGHR